DDDRELVGLLRGCALRCEALPAAVPEARSERGVLPVSGVRGGLVVALLAVALLAGSGLVLAIALRRLRRRAVAARCGLLGMGIVGRGLAPSVLRWLRHVLLRRR